MTERYVVGDFFNQLRSHYQCAGNLRVPYAYSQLNQVYAATTELTQSTSEGYSTRKKPTISSYFKRWTNPTTNTSRNLNFSLYMYDLFYGVLPWTLGINRKSFAFDDCVVVAGQFSGLSRVDPPTTMSLSVSDYQLTLSYYDMTTGRLVIEQKLKMRLASDVLISDYWMNLADYQSDFSGVDKFFELSIYEGFAVDAYIVDEYSVPNNPLAHQKRSTTYEWLTDTSVYQETTTTTIYPDPVYKLIHTSALDSGAWTNYPLGNSAWDFVARKLGIPFNNRYATTQTGAGVIQIQEAVQADMELAFSLDPANAGINFGDLRALWQAVQNYFGVMAANICSWAKLPRVFNAIFQAKLDKQFFFSSIWPAPMDAAITEALGFIKEDYSLSDDVVTLKGYLQKYWDYMGSEGVFYRTTSGENVKRLGAAANNVQRILTAYKEAQTNAYWVAEIRERNILVEQAKFQGSFELLDKSFTPQPGVAMTAYIGYLDTAVICTGYSINIDASGNFRTMVNYVKKMG